MILFVFNPLYNKSGGDKMFELAENRAIGENLSRLINKKYKSVRQFGKEYIKLDGRIADDDETRKMSNRLSQIINGDKSIQIYDLPIFTKLLDVSCEEILSAGKCFSASSNHLTNYLVATSKDKNEWLLYLNMEEQIILNADEYGKTVIDYALDFENYEFLKFLMDEKIIWLVKTKENGSLDFGAGTKIECNGYLFKYHNILRYRMDRSELRMGLISLALKRNDVDMLTKLRAREIPTLYYQIGYYLPPDTPNMRNKEYFDSEFIQVLSTSSSEILEYFSEEFEITNTNDCKHRVMYPFISELIEALLKNGNDYVQPVLKKAIAHNQYVYSRLTELIDAATSYYKELYDDDISSPIRKDYIVKNILRNLYFSDDGDYISYQLLEKVACKPCEINGIFTNFVKAKGTSDNPRTKDLIQELNDLYDKIKNITPNL